MKDMKFVIIILLMFFGVGIMAQINDYDYSVNNTGIMYQENNNIALNEKNRFYDYDIDFNLNESYLHYSPIKKGGLLDNYNNNKNLAMPDLEGKEYLGDGTYVLMDDDVAYATYNVYTGKFYVEKFQQGVSTIAIFTSMEVGVEYTAKISNLNIINDGFNFSISLQIYYGSSLNTRHTIWGPTQIENSFTFIQDMNGGRLSFNQVFTMEFHLQIEKGDIATAYQVPYIPALKIDFKGTNQVEYINPFKEQVIDINDISNVNNIEFELLNTKNPVVFNWNITTNPNIPFVRFYNNQTKLLYDFTDVNEMNSIGNSLISSRSNMINIFNNALDLVNTFYEGFQKLFNTDTIESIRDALSGVWPLLPPQWPWTR